MTGLNNLECLKILLCRGVVFGAAAGDSNGNYYFAGGRSYSHTSGKWDYLDAVWKFNTGLNNWQEIPSLKNRTGKKIYFVI